MDTNSLPLPHQSTVVIENQPCHKFQPWQFLSTTDNGGEEENFEEILEQQQSSAGFEIVADTNLFTVRHRFHEKDPYTKISKYDVLDGNHQQYLFVCCKDYSYRCFKSLSTTKISVFTDSYKDPIFITTCYFSTQQQFCCKIATTNGKTIGSIQPVSPAGSTSHLNDFMIQNVFEDTNLNIICNNNNSCHDEESQAETNYDVWEEASCVANISLDETTSNIGIGEITLCTIGSLTSVNKVLLLGFSFYIDGIQRGDSRLNLYSLIGL